MEIGWITEAAFIEDVSCSMGIFLKANRLHEKRF